MARSTQSPPMDARALRGGSGVVNGSGVLNGFERSFDDTEMVSVDTAVETIYRIPCSETRELGNVKVFYCGGPHGQLTIGAKRFLWAESGAASMEAVEWCGTCQRESKT